MSEQMNHEKYRTQSEIAEFLRSMAVGGVEYYGAFIIQRNSDRFFTVANPPAFGPGTQMATAIEAATYIRSNY